MPTEISQAELCELVWAARDGSTEHFQKLYDLYSKPIFNFIWRLIGSLEDAEDLTQETFLKVHSEISNLREPSQFKFWLYRIARNEVYQKLRKSQKTTEISIDDDGTSISRILPDESSHRDPERQYLSRELDEVLTQALSSLTPKYRDVFVLAVFQKLSYEEITQVVGRSLLSVKTDIYRARLAVKSALNEYLAKHNKK